MSFTDQILRLSPMRRGPLPLRLAAAMEVLQGGGGAVANGTTYSRSALTSGDGDHLEGASGWAMASTGALLFYGSIGALGATAGFLAGAVGSTTSTGGVRLYLATATSIACVYRRSGSGSGEVASYAIADATTYGPRLYYVAWSTSYSGARCGVDDMLADATYGTNANNPATLAADRKPSFMARASALADPNNDVTGTGCWAVLINRALTADEWADAAAGDYSWAVGDGDLEWIFAPSGAAVGAEVDGSTNLATGGPYTVVNDGPGSVADVPMTVAT